MRGRFCRLSLLDTSQLCPPPTGCRTPRQGQALLEVPPGPQICCNGPAGLLNGSSLNLTPVSLHATLHVPSRPPDAPCRTPAFEGLALPWAEARPQAACPASPCVTPFCELRCGCRAAGHH